MQIQSIEPLHLDQIAGLGETFARALESGADDRILVAEGVLVNLTELANQLIKLENDPRIGQATGQIGSTFGLAIRISEAQAPELVAEIAEVAAWYQPEPTEQ